MTQAGQEAQMRAANWGPAMGNSGAGGPGSWAASTPAGEEAAWGQPLVTQKTFPHGWKFGHFKNRKFDR